MKVVVHPSIGDCYAIDVPIDDEDNDEGYGIGYLIDDYISENYEDVVSYDFIKPEDEYLFG